MKFILVVFLSAIIAIAVSEPLAYRQRSVIRTSARQTDSGGVALQAEFGDSTTPVNNVAAKNDGDDEATAVAPNQPAQNGPYLPTGWRPLGQLLVLPFAVRENLDSTATNVETKSFNSNANSETTEETATETSTDQQKSTEVETSEPKTKKPTAAYKKPPQKFVGELNAANAKDGAKAGTAEAKTTTETDDEATTTEAQKEDLETTSEPESEAVDSNAEKSSVDDKQSTNAQSPAPAPQFPQTEYFVQLPDGSLQRIVYLQPQAQAQVPAQAVFLPQPVAASGNLRFQQLNQAPNYPFAFNPIVNPKIVTFSSQYQAF